MNQRAAAPLRELFRSLGKAPGPLWWGIGVLTSVIFLVVAFSGVDLGAAADRLRGVRYDWLLLAAALAVLTPVAKAARWRYLWGGHPPPLWRIITGILAAQSINAVVPARAGDVSRAYFIRHYANGAWALTTVALEKLIDLLILGALFIALVMYLPDIPLERPVSGATAVVGALVAIAAVIIWKRHGARRLVMRLATRILGENPARSLHTFPGRLRAVATVRAAIGITLWSLVVWTLQMVMVGAALLATGLQPSLMLVLAVLVLQYLGSPAPSPGRVGTHQALSIIALVLFSVPRETAAAFSVVLYSVSVALPLVLGLVALWAEVRQDVRSSRIRERPHVPEFRSAATPARSRESV